MTARTRGRARTAVRLLHPDDAPALAELVTGDWPFLAPYEPERSPEWFTAEGQRAVVTALLDLHAQDRAVPWAIEHGGRLVGRATLTEVSRGPAQSAHLGYFVAEAVNGRGVATDAVGQVVANAFGELGLHRVQAGTLLANTASQAVLQRNGFERIGVARRYLRIAGEWQDHLLYQRTA